MSSTRDCAGKILMLAESDFPLDGRVRNEALTLSREGYKVTVICGRSKGQMAREVFRGIEVYRVPRLSVFDKVPGLRARSWGRALHLALAAAGYVVEHAYFPAVCLLLSPYILLRQGFDVIHAHNPPDTLFVVGAFYRLFGKKFVFDHHDLSPELFLSRFSARDGVLYRALLLLERLCVGSANACIATNESYREIEIARANKDPNDVFVVRNGPDLDALERTPDESLRPPGKKLLVYVGVMNPQDGLEYLLRAMRCLVVELGRSDFRCVLVGTGDSLARLRDLSAELGLADCVQFTGFIPREEVMRYLATADICLDPDPSSPLNDVSTWIKIMEYMSFGKPIVSFDLKETRVSAGGAAVYVEPNDEKAFARAIASLMDDPERRRAMGALGARRVEQELAWQHVSRNLIRAYRSILPAGRARRADPKPSPS
ncbi:MAG: glycosyltransferase family 4 protein [bacterium]